jgi:outer membrane beta-barrel protein
MRTTIISLLFLLSFSAAAYGADVRDEPVLKNRRLYRGARHEITPAVGVTLFDHYQHHVFVGVGYKYFIFDWLGVGGEFLYAAPVLTSLGNDVKSEYSKPGTENDPNFGTTVTSSHIQFMANAVIELTPLSGKAMILSQVPFAYDFHVMGGAGFVNVKGEGSLDDKPGFSPFFGAGMRFFVTPGIAVSLDVRDYMVNMVEAGSLEGLNKSASFVHNVAFMMGVNFLLPFELATSKN